MTGSPGLLDSAIRRHHGNSDPHVKRFFPARRKKVTALKFNGLTRNKSFRQTALVNRMTLVC